MRRNLLNNVLHIWSGKNLLYICAMEATSEVDPDKDAIYSAQLNKKACSLWCPGRVLRGPGRVRDLTRLSGHTKAWIITSVFI